MDSAVGARDVNANPPGVRFFVFTVNGWRLALPLAAVRRVLASVEVTPLPGAPAVVAGAIDVHGRVVPVIDLARPARGRAHEVGLGDRLILARSRRRELALLASEVEGLHYFTEDRIAEPGAVSPCAATVHGIARGDDGLVLIHDLDALLPLEDERRLDDALAALVACTGSTA